MEPRYEMETFLNERAPLSDEEEERENKAFINSLDYFHLAHKSNHIHVHLLYPVDFQQRLTISIYRHSVSHLQARGHHICTVKDCKPLVIIKLEA